MPLTPKPTPSPDEFQKSWNSINKVIHSLKAEADSKRTWSEKMADWITAHFGSTTFLILNIVFFAIWLTLNLNLIPGLIPFDPFPFGLLTSIVSLEAIILAIFVLISQNRSAKVDALRDETDLHVDTMTEIEITKVMQLLTLLTKKQGIDLSQDNILQEMLKPADTKRIEQALERQVAK